MGRLFSPPFPAFISGHASFAGAFEVMMKSFFGRDDIRFTARIDDPNARGRRRTFPSFTAAAEEDGRSRIYLRVHYEWDNQGGLNSGRKVAKFGFGNVFTRKKES